MVLFRHYYEQHISLFPPDGPIARLMTKILLYFFLAGSAFFLLPHDLVFPGGSLFSVFLLYMFSEIFGVITKQIFYLPSLVGMILAGVFVSNVPIFHYHVHFHMSSSLRNIAFIALLTRAGLELDTDALLKMKRVCLLLSFVPGVCAESPVVAVTAKFLLGLPWGWAFMIGFIMAAVSPAIVVACILKLQDKGYGTSKGIPTLVIASSSVDDIVAICAFSVAMTMTFASGSVAWVVCKAPMEFVGGAIPGALIGVIFWYLPAKTDSHKIYLRYTLIFLVNMTAFFGAEHAETHGAGPLFVITAAFVASRDWTKGGGQYAHDVEEVEKQYAITWRYLAPLLFGLIGAELKLNLLDWEVMAFSLLIVTLGVMARLAAAYICCLGVGLNWKEKLFVSISSIPKATVQAAIGSEPLDYVRTLHNTDMYRPEYEEWARKILAIAVVSVVLTAPLGAVLTKLSGTYLLDRNDPDLIGHEGANDKKHSLHEAHGQKILEKFNIDHQVEI